MTRTSYKIVLQRMLHSAYFVVAATIFIFLLMFALFGYKSGAAKNGEAVSGAPFNSSQTCSKCHSGGSFGGTINVKLLNASNVAVTSYVPGQTYTLNITMKKTSTATAKYGFQTTCATSANANINKWGALPKQTHNSKLSGHNYIEQSSALTSGVIKIPWTAPAKGTGSVIFYAAGNIVNGNGSTSGDQPVKKNLTVTEAPVAMPVIYSNFSGSIVNDKAQLNWSTSHEESVGSFVIQKSMNGTDFSDIAKVDARGLGSYRFTDAAFDTKAYYRIGVTAIDGSVFYNDKVLVEKPDKNNYKLSLYAHGGTNYVMFSNGYKEQRVQVIYSDMQGNIFSSGITTANEGDNVWPIPANKNKGVIIISVVTEDGIRTSLKIAQQ